MPMASGGLATSVGRSEKGEAEDGVDGGPSVDRVGGPVLELGRTRLTFRGRRGRCSRTRSVADDPASAKRRHDDDDDDDNNNNNDDNDVGDVDGVPDLQSDLLLS